MKCNRLFCGILALACLAATPSHAAKPDPFLNEIQHRCFLFFWKETDPVTGVTKDRANNFQADTYDIGSIASTGFALSALPIGVERKWVARDDARARALLTLRFFNDHAPRIHGVYPHFLKFGTGERAWNCEYSTIDTTLLVSGAITAGEYFGGEVKERAERLYRDVDWVYWTPHTFVSMGFRPQDGAMMTNDWSGYSEGVLLYILAIGSPTHSIPQYPWHKMGRFIARYGPYSTVAGSSLFVNQYQNLWVDFRGRGDGVADYWEIARTNTLANRDYCISQSDRYPGFGPDVWGLTAGDGPTGYEAFAAEPGGAYCNGTINPHAVGGSYMFTPVESRRALRAMLDKYGKHIWGRYGFSDGFNVGKAWWAPDVIGIDTGATLLSIENHRTGIINRLFMKNAATEKALRRIGMAKIKRPRATKPVAVFGALSLVEGAPKGVTFSMPKAPSAWKQRQVVLYGGVIEERTVRVTLNQKGIGRAVVPHGKARAAGFRVPAGLIRWGAKNRLTMTLENGGKATYGPIWIGPLEGLDYKPLKVLVE